MGLIACERQEGFDQQFSNLLKTLGRNPFDRMNSSELSTLERRSNDDNYEISMDVSQFNPEDVQIKVTGRQIVIEAKHDERDDRGCKTTRHFVRKYSLPADCNPNDVTSSLSSNGVLKVVTPRAKQIKDGEHSVPVTMTGPYNRIKF